MSSSSSTSLVQAAYRSAGSEGGRGRKVSARVVVPGEVLLASEGYLRGHGTYPCGGYLRATVSGVVTQVNKLISVVPLKSRYVAEIGDVVVGRIVEVGHKRWKVDVQAPQSAGLPLSSINIPGSSQRRRSAADELLMRSFFAEGDLISAEVQSLYADGGCSLATRSTKYGKLQNGILLSLHPSLIKRSASHFHSFPCGVDVIFGFNGYVWISPSPEDGDGQSGNGEGGEGSSATTSMNDISSTKTAKGLVSVAVDLRKKIIRMRNVILALNTVFVAIYPDSVWTAYQASLDADLPLADILLPANMELITAPVRQAHDEALEASSSILNQ